MKKRPPRLSRVFDVYATPLYEVTFCSRNRRSILANSSVHEAFLQACQVAHDNNAAVGRYVIMPDHVHAFIRVGVGARLDLSVRCLKRTMTKRIHKKEPGIDVWQEGFFDHLIRNSESYAEKWEYVRQNPVVASLVSDPNEWPYQGEFCIIDRP
jgi:putative transposase